MDGLPLFPLFHRPCKSAGAASRGESSDPQRPDAHPQARPGADCGGTEDSFGAVSLLRASPTVPLESYLKPWQGQPVWLETALEGQTITLTKHGAAFEANTASDFLPAHADAALHCHYHIRQEENALIFHTWRTPEDLKQLLTEAEALGVTLGVGLYQELGETAIDAKVNL